MTTRRVFWCLLTAVSLGLGPISRAADAAPGGPASLPEEVFPQLENILKDALAQSPSMVRANLRRLEAEGNERASTAVLYPRFDAQFQINQQMEERADLSGTNNTVKTYYNVGASRPLFHWGAVRAAVENGRIATAMEENNVREGFRLLALDIRWQYLQLIVNKASLRKARSDLEVQQRRLAIVREQAASGQVPPGAVAGAEIGITETELSIDRLAHSLDRAVRAFRRLTGREGFSEADIPNEIPEVAVMADGAAEAMRAGFVGNDAVENRVRLANQRLERERAERSVHIARVELRPKFNLRAGAYQDEISYTANVGRKYRVQAIFVGVQCSWTIFDGFAARGRTAAARARLRQAELQAAEIREDLLTQAEDSVVQIGFSARSLASTERRLAGARSMIAFTRTQVEEGRGTEDAVLTAELGLSAAEIRAFSARAEYFRDVANLLSALESDPAVNALAAPTRTR